MTFGKVLYEFIHPLNLLTSKSAIFLKSFGHTHGPHIFTLLDVFFSQFDVMSTLTGFQNLKLSIFKTPSKEKKYADFPKIQRDVFIWKYRESFLAGE